MHLEPHLAQVHDQLTAAAALGDDRTKEVAGALATAVGPAVRLAVLDALSAAADEITAALLDQPGSPTVSVRQDGDEIRVGVAAGASGPATAEPRRDDGDTSARISLRLSESLKFDIDDAADRDGVSVNTWLVRAAATALDSADGRGGGPGRGRGRHDHHRVTGWING